MEWTKTVELERRPTLLEAWSDAIGRSESAWKDRLLGMIGSSAIAAYLAVTAIIASATIGLLAWKTIAGFTH